LLGEFVNVASYDRGGNAVEVRAEFIGKYESPSRCQSHGQSKAILLPITEMCGLIENTEDIVEAGLAQHSESGQEVPAYTVDQGFVGRQIYPVYIYPVRGGDAFFQFSENNTFAGTRWPGDADDVAGPDVNCAVVGYGLIG
jgi:hypothetical protein